MDVMPMLDLLHALVEHQISSNVPFRFLCFLLRTPSVSCCWRCFLMTVAASRADRMHRWNYQCCYVYFWFKGIANGGLIAVSFHRSSRLLWFAADVRQYGLQYTASAKMVQTCFRWNCFMHEFHAFWNRSCDTSPGRLEFTQGMEHRWTPP